METCRSDWITEKKRIALCLAKGGCGGSYSEAMLILCSALSARAAEVWPGEGFDRKRFVEALKEYTPPNLGVTQISIPLLAGHLRTQNMSTEAKLVEKTFLDYLDCRILTGSEVDRSENDILAVCNTVNAKDIRECSYANLLYREVRSSYVHEYTTGKRADFYSMTQDSRAYVSYLNRMDGPDRCIHFQVNWVTELAIAMAQAIDRVADTIPREPPTKWWIEG